MPATPTRPHSLLLSTTKSTARLLPIADLTSLVTTATDNTTHILTKGVTGTKGLTGTTASSSYVASINSTISLTNGEGIEWSAPVVSIRRVTPFIVTLLSNITVEIHQESTLLSLQIITLLSPPVRIMTKPLNRGYMCPIPLYSGGVPEDVFLYVDMSGVDSSSSTSMGSMGMSIGGGSKDKKGVGSSSSSGNEVHYLTMTPLSQQV